MPEQNDADTASFNIIRLRAYSLWRTPLALIIGLSLRHLYDNPAKGVRVVRNGNLTWVTQPLNLCGRLLGHGAARWAWRPLAAYLRRSSTGSPPAGEHVGGDRHPASLVDRDRFVPADVAHDLRVVGERGRRRGIGEDVLLFFLHSVEDGSCDRLRRGLRYVGVSDLAKILQCPRGAGIAERPGAIARNRQWNASPRGEGPAAPRRRRHGRSAPRG